MKLIWSKDGKTVIVGLENLVEVYIRDVVNEDSPKKGHRYLVHARTMLSRVDRTDGIFLKEYSNLEEAQDYIINDLSVEYSKTIGGLSRKARE